MTLVVSDEILTASDAEGEKKEKGKELRMTN
jgi:hypothetical protein